MRIRKQIQLSADGRVAASRLRSCQAAAAGARIAACRQGARDDECERADVCRLVCEVSVIRSVDRLLTTTYQFRSFVHSCLVAWGPPSVEAECDIVFVTDRSVRFSRALELSVTGTDPHR